MLLAKQARSDCCVYEHNQPVRDYALDIPTTAGNQRDARACTRQ